MNLPRPPRSSPRASRAAPWAIAAILLTTACTGRPAGVAPVQGFELSRYLGRWYEIARLDHSFERGLERVTADYTLREDGGIDVVNRGYAPATGEWEQASGKAYFVGDADVGHLKVAFFGPFYASYVIFELDETDYGHAFVSGPDTSYLWLLARTSDVDESLIERFVSRAPELGFDTDELVFVSH